jgi:alpha-tubulin suppressor-like RCC1 family protein
VNSATPVRVSDTNGNALNGLTRVATGGTHTCALRNDETVWCWGNNSSGQLGNGALTGCNLLCPPQNTYSETPVQAKNLTNAVAIAAGSAHSCAVLADSGVKCWGSDFIGEAGSPIGVALNTPRLILNFSGATTISLGGGHSFTIMTDGSTRSWGNNFYGQLGNGTTTNFSTPVTVNL